MQSDAQKILKNSEKLVDVVSINVILKSLDVATRRKFLQLLDSENFDAAEKLIKNHIPNLDQKIETAVKNHNDQIIKSISKNG